MQRLTFLHQGLTPELMKKAKEELGETEEIKEKTLQELHSLIKAEPDFHPLLENWFLLRFLRAAKYKVERAFLLLKRYYKFRATHTEWVKKPSEVMHVLEEGHFCFPEYRDDNGVNIAIIRVGHYDIEKFTVDELLALGFVALEISLLAEATQICGYSIIDDLGKITLGEVKHYASPSLFYRILNVLQDCLPGRLKSFHIINEPFYCGILIKVFKMFMTEKLKKRVLVHGNNLKSLHEKIPPELLPEEFGGTQGPMSTSVATLKEKFLLYEDHFIMMSQYGYRGKTLEKLRKS